MISSGLCLLRFMEFLGARRASNSHSIWLNFRGAGQRAFAKWGPIIQSHGSSVRKKKAVIACVRLLFIDLWRLFTARATLADLGFRGVPTK
jgi:hypothetical protein